MYCYSAEEDLLIRVLKHKNYRGRKALYTVVAQLINSVKKMEHINHNTDDAFNFLFWLWRHVDMEDLTACDNNPLAGCLQPFTNIDVTDIHLIPIPEIAASLIQNIPESQRQQDR